MNMIRHRKTCRSDPEIYFELQEIESKELNNLTLKVLTSDLNKLDLNKIKMEVNGYPSSKTIHLREIIYNEEISQQKRRNEAKKEAQGNGYLFICFYL